jgi:hypothetical protein
VPLGPELVPLGPELVPLRPELVEGLLMMSFDKPRTQMTIMAW